MNFIPSTYSSISHDDKLKHHHVDGYSILNILLIIISIIIIIRLLITVGIISELIIG